MKKFIIASAVLLASVGIAAAATLEGKTLDFAGLGCLPVLV